MTAPLFRSVHGYPHIHLMADSAEVKLNNGAEFTQAHNPGEVLGWNLFQLSGTQSAWLNLMLYIEVDSVILFDDYVYYYANGFNFAAFSNLFADSSMYNTTLNLVNFRVHIPFSDMFKIILHNSDPVGNWLYLNVYSRYGR